MTTTLSTTSIAAARERTLTATRDIAALQAAYDLAYWDEETYLPANGSESRAAMLEALEATIHKRTASRELSDSAAELLALAEPSSTDARVATLALRRSRFATAVPSELVRALTLAKAESSTTWKVAKETGQPADVATHADSLARLVVLTRERADALVAAGIADDPHSALIAEFEPDLTSGQVKQLVAGVAVATRDLPARATRTVDNDWCVSKWPERGQEDLAREVASALGYQFAAGRLDRSVHPFSTAFGPGDARITWSVGDDWWWGLGSVIHEVGHAMYEQNLPAGVWGNPISAATSYGAHESQSRLQECHVAGHRSFWTWCAPLAARYLPGFPSDLDRIWDALHTMRPGPIRLEADEVTYDGHIAVRVEVEAALLDGSLAVADLPTAWDEAYAHYVGTTGSDFATGWGQDPHFAYGDFGYFGSYTVGNAGAAQLFAAAHRELSDLDAQFAAGDFSQLFAWLRANVWQHGSTLTFPQIVERATGAPLSGRALIEHLADIANHAPIAR